MPMATKVLAVLELTVKVRQASANEGSTAGLPRRKRLRGSCFQNAITLSTSVITALA